MNRHDQEERELFAKIMGFLATACSREINRVTIDTYWKSLADLPIESVERAADQLRRTWKHPGLLPTPGQIREASEPNVECAATTALATLEKAMGATGVYNCVKFLDETLAATVESYGGWVAVINVYRDLETRDLSFWQREFRQRYKLFAEASRIPKHKFLQGLGEAETHVDVYATDGEKARVLLSLVASDGNSLPEAKLRARLLTGPIEG